MTRARIAFAGCCVIAALATTEAAANADSFGKRLAPGQSVTYSHGADGFNCPRGFFTNVDVNGSGIQPEHWSEHHSVIEWPAYDGGQVIFNGITFTNYTRVTVHVKGLCPA